MPVPDPRVEALRAVLARATGMALSDATLREAVAAVEAAARPVPRLRPDPKVGAVAEPGRAVSICGRTFRIGAVYPVSSPGRPPGGSDAPRRILLRYWPDRPGYEDRGGWVRAAVSGGSPASAFTYAGSVWARQAGPEVPAPTTGGGGRGEGEG